MRDNKMLRDSYILILLSITMLLLFIFAALVDMKQNHEDIILTIDVEIPMSPDIIDKPVIEEPVAENNSAPYFVYIGADAV